MYGLEVCPALTTPPARQLQYNIIHKTPILGGGGLTQYREYCQCILSPVDTVNINLTSSSNESLFNY